MALTAMTHAKQPKAPFRCYWRGRLLWAAVRINGKRYAWSLRTDDPAIAIERLDARIKALREPVKAKAIKRRVMAGEVLTEEERTFVASAIDLAMGKSPGPAWLTEWRDR